MRCQTNTLLKSEGKGEVNFLIIVALKFIYFLIYLYMYLGQQDKAVCRPDTKDSVTSVEPVEKKRRLKVKHKGMSGFD